MIDYAEAAVVDLDDIWSYTAITQGSPAQAERLMDNLRTAIELLAEQPRMGREHNDWKQGLRMFTVRRYLILYREIEGGVLIERVLNAYRNIEGLLREPRAE